MNIRVVPFLVGLAAASLAAPEPVLAYGNMATPQAGENTDSTGNYGNGEHGRHPRRGSGESGRWKEGPDYRRRGEGGVDVGIEREPRGYGRDRIGPPTACEEIAHWHADLERLWQIRAQANAGEQMVYRDDAGRLRAMSMRRLLNDLNVASSVVFLEQPDSIVGRLDSGAVRRLMRKNSLVTLDAQIGRTQDRIGQLRYDCND
jgi:hypothetical protein